MESEDDEEEKAKELEEAHERARKLEERAAELQKRLEEDSGMKDELKQRFVQELMRRQEVSGTFEETMGTVFPFHKYDEEDPCAAWFNSEKGQDINGEDWDPLYDAEYLRNGIKGWGTDEDAIVAVVSTRSNSQRNTMLKEYKTAYGRDLIKDLKGDLSGNFEEAILALFETPARYDAWSIKHALYGLGTDEATIIEILMTRTNAQIQETVHEYNKIAYKKKRPINPEDNIEKDIEDDCSGDFKRLLISACQGNRRLLDEEKLAESIDAIEQNGKWTGMFAVNYNQLCNEKKCERMAQELFDAGEEKWGTDEETFNRIFSTQDYYTLRTVYDKYVKISQRDIINAVEKETSGDYKRGLKAIAQSIKCRPMFFAERLYKSMKGAGTKDSTLIRIVATRSEIDMIQIKGCFLEKYGQTLWNFVKDDTSGDYRKLLLGIVGRD
jgi:annexin A7/11